MPESVLAYRAQRTKSTMFFPMRPALGLMPKQTEEAVC